ncbi:MAG: outer membrane beta-barrel protein [Steroidobacteraceae bacterium]
MNKITRIAATAAALATLGGVSTAMAAEGPYIGASVLQARFDQDNFDVDDVDDDDISFKVFAGIQLTPLFGLEAGYTNFGSSDAPSVPTGGTFKAEAEAWSGFGTLSFPAGPVQLFAKAGMARIDADGNVGAVTFDDKSWEFAYGVGAQLNFGNLGVRAEYERFDTDVVGDLDVISVGVVFKFGTT